MLIKIEKTVTLEDLDRYYSQLNRFADVDGVVDVQLPKQLENNFVGLVPSIIQFLITWVRYKYSGNLWLDIENPDQEDFDRLFENELLFPAFILAWNKAAFYNNTGEINIKSFLKEPLQKIRNEMVKVKAQKGNKMLLVSIDHFPYSSGSLPAFEGIEGFIDNEANSTRNLRFALENVLSYSNDAKRVFGKYGRDFISIIHELFKNTYEWAKTDSNNVPLDPSIRGVFIKFYKKRRATFLNEFKTHKGLRSYFESQSHVENSQQELYFIEISVFDSGIGFVDKFDSPDKEKLSDIDIVKRCLMLHMTSAQGLEKDDKGIGLDQILRVLDKKGLLRIKTNKRCVYRNMITHPYKTVSAEKDLDLFDWHKGTPDTFTDELPVAGATLTILYPLATNLSI